jgi:hypothetical protein
MSALPPKADMVRDDPDVRFVPKADSCGAAIVTTAIPGNCEEVAFAQLALASVRFCLNDWLKLGKAA